MFHPDLCANRADDEAFLCLVARIVTGSVLSRRPPEVRIFKIDNWFDHKWLGFCGKMLGAAGMWKTRLTVPPFVANRIINQEHYVRDEETGIYQAMGPGPNIHHRGWAATNLHRYIKHIVPNSALFWYSGNTATTGRGSLMAHLPVESEEHWSWFLAFGRNAEWRILRRKNIHAHEIRLFLETPTVDSNMADRRD